AGAHRRRNERRSRLGRHGLQPEQTPDGFILRGSARRALLSGAGPPPVTRNRLSADEKISALRIYSSYLVVDAECSNRELGRIVRRTLHDDHRAPQATPGDFCWQPLHQDFVGNHLSESCYQRRKIWTIQNCVRTPANALANFLARLRPDAI